MSAISQYTFPSAGIPSTIISGGVGQEFSSSTPLTAVLPVGAAPTDCVSLVLQAGVYSVESQIGLTVANTGTVSNLAIYLSSAAAGASIIAQQTEIIELTAVGDIPYIARITSTVSISAATTLYVGFSGTVGVLDVTINSASLSCSKSAY
jgi:hypothetical protein